MHDRALTPQQAWQQVGEQVIADHRTADCEIFLDFLCAACTYHTPAALAVGPDTPATAQTLPLVTPFADNALRHQVWGWLARDLPALA